MVNNYLLRVDWDRVEIHPLLEPTFKFLIDIDREIKYLLNDNTWNILRSQIICVFAYLETIVCLFTLYKAKEKLSDDDLKRETQKNVRKFINSYVINLKNMYYKENMEKFKWINTESLKDLRNMVTHFYSVPDSLWIIQEMRIKRPDKEKLKEEWHCFISPKELYNLLEWSSNALIKDRFLDSKKDYTKFKYWITNVIDMVAWNAAKINSIPHNPQI